MAMMTLSYVEGHVWQVEASATFNERQNHGWMGQVWQARTESSNAVAPPRIPLSPSPHSPTLNFQTLFSIFKNLRHILCVQILAAKNLIAQVLLLKFYTSDACCDVTGLELQLYKSKHAT